MGLYCRHFFQVMLHTTESFFHIKLCSKINFNDEEKVKVKASRIRDLYRKISGIFKEILKKAMDDEDLLAQQREDEVLFQFELAHKRIKSAVENNVRSTALSDKTNITGAILRGTYEDQESKSSKRKATLQKVFTMAHGSDFDFTEIINDGNNHLQQPTNYNSPLDDIQFQNNFSSVNSLQTDNSEIFRLSIPSFKIIVIPNSVNLANLDLQNLFPQDSNPNIVTENSQTHPQNTFGLNDSFDFNNFW
ncbi:hypothetical protein RhiirA1_476559 [Rhizophagus irregularis]|uniref:Uncharacterized protein n=1 Tax=Rhizophagus irregularis TaxID=588596 RepID=A0A2N0QUW5_9GLOM|nr:hypothetical protein RhiirA1_476559 [Rhizophagus irregularis]